MAEKILALLAAFMLGVAAAFMLGSKMVNVALQHSPRLRAMVRAQLDLEDGVDEADPFVQECVDVATGDLCASSVSYTDKSGKLRAAGCINPRLEGETLCAEHLRQFHGNDDSHTGA